MVGVDDPDTETFTLAAETRENPANMGTSRSRDERGLLSCVAESWSGDPNQKTARDAAYATTAAVAGLVRNRATPPFGVASLITVEFVEDSQRLMQGQFTVGAVARVHFSISFHARL